MPSTTRAAVALVLAAAAASAHPGHEAHRHRSRFTAPERQRLLATIRDHPQLAEAERRGALRRFEVRPGHPAALLLPAFRPPVVVDLAPGASRVLPAPEAAPPVAVQLSVRLVAAAQPTAHLTATLASGAHRTLVAAPPDMQGGWQLHPDGVFRVDPGPRGSTSLTSTRPLPAGHPGPFELSGLVPHPLDRAVAGEVEIELDPGAAPVLTYGLTRTTTGPARARWAPHRATHAGFFLLPAPAQEVEAPTTRPRPDPPHAGAADPGSTSGPAPAATPAPLRTYTAGLTPAAAAPTAALAQRLFSATRAQLGMPAARGRLLLLPRAPDQPAWGRAAGDLCAVRILDPGRPTTGAQPAARAGAEAAPSRTPTPAEAAVLAHELAHLLIDGPRAGAAPDALREGLANLLALDALRAHHPEGYTHLRGSLSRSLLGMHVGALTAPSLAPGTQHAHGDAAHQALRQLTAYAYQPAALQAAAGNQPRRFWAAIAGWVRGLEDEGPTIPGLIEALRDTLPFERLDQLRQDLTGAPTKDRRRELAVSLYR